MGYAVFHRDGTDTPRVEDVDSLESAVAIVERLRNQDATSDVRIFREVPLEVRTYYKVVVAEQDAPADAGADAAPTEVAPTPPPAPAAAVDATPTDEAASGSDSALWQAAPPTDDQTLDDLSSLESDDEAAAPAEPVAAGAPVAAAAPVGPLPGAFPLAARTAPPHVEVNDTNVDGDAGRRHSLFGRGG